MDYFQINPALQFQVDIGEGAPIASSILIRNHSNNISLYQLATCRYDMERGFAYHIINSKVKHIIKSTSNATSKQRKKTVSVSVSATVASAMFAYLWHVADRVSCIYASLRLASSRLVVVIIAAYCGY